MKEEGGGGDEKRLKFERHTNNFLKILLGRQHSYNEEREKYLLCDSINKRERQWITKTINYLLSTDIL